MPRDIHRIRDEASRPISAHGLRDPRLEHGETGAEGHLPLWEKQTGRPSCVDWGFDGCWRTECATSCFVAGPTAVWVDGAVWKLKRSQGPRRAIADINRQLLSARLDEGDQTIQLSDGDQRVRDRGAPGPT